MAALAMIIMLLGALALRWAEPVMKRCEQEPRSDFTTHIAPIVGAAFVLGIMSFSGGAALLIAELFSNDPPPQPMSDTY